MDKACIEIRDLMALGGETSDNERIAIESHVSVCAECARELAEMRSLVGNLALLREGEMPAGAAERIWRGVRTAVPGHRRATILRWSARIAAVLVIGLAVGYTSKSLTAGGAASHVAIDEPSLDDERPTIVSGVRSIGAIDGGPESVVPMGSRHYLPSVDEILDSDVVRF